MSLRYRELFTELQEKTDMRILLIKNGTIWDGEKFFCGDICVSDGKISEIAEHIEN